MKQIILQDIDGCLLEWLSKLPEFLVKKGLKPDRAILSYASGEYVSPEELTGLPSDKAYALIEEYNASDYIKYLTPFKDALAVINLIKHEFDFIAVTAIGRHESSTKNRMINLDFWFPGAFSGIHCVDIEASKQEILNSYSRTFFIDDSPTYCAEGIKAGHDTIRLVRDSRMDKVGTVRCNNYYEVLNYIRSKQ